MADDFAERMPRGWFKPDRPPNERIMHPQTTGMWGTAPRNGLSRGSVVLGYDDGGRFCGYDDDRHFITFAGSRAGKGVSLIVPTMLSYGGSVLAIDPKGELATITASRRGDGSDYAEGMGGRVFVLDPFERAEGEAVALRAAFNPLAGIDHETGAGLARATMIADGLVIQEQGSGAHFTASARSLLRGLILYVCATESGDKRSLVRVRELIAQPLKDFEAMLTHMVKLGGTIGRAASSLKLKSDNERTSVISTADVQTDFLEDDAMRSVLEGHDFDLEDMKRERVTVYLCLPAGKLATHGRWLRLMVGLAMNAMEETGALEEGKTPVLFVLDEFAALGHMASVEKAAGQIASFGVKLWPVLQDVTQLKRDYKDSWETFIGNAGMVTAFGVSDATTTDYLSKILGKTSIQTFSSSDSSNMQQSGGSRGISNSVSVSVVNLLDPHEVARNFAREEMRLLCLPQGREPFIIRRAQYFADFIGYHDPAPGRSPPPTRVETEAKAQAAKDAETAGQRAERERHDAAEARRQAEADRKREQREAAAKAAADTAKAAAQGVRNLAGFAKRKFDERGKGDD